jgi:hypothetical protein
MYCWWESNRRRGKGSFTSGTAFSGSPGHATRRRRFESCFQHQQRQLHTWWLLQRFRNVILLPSRYVIAYLSVWLLKLCLSHSGGHSNVIFHLRLWLCGLTKKRYWARLVLNSSRDCVILLRFIIYIENPSTYALCSL